MRVSGKQNQAKSSKIKQNKVMAGLLFWVRGRNLDDGAEKTAD